MLAAVPAGADQPARKKRGGSGEEKPEEAGKRSRKKRGRSRKKRGSLEEAAKTSANRRLTQTSSRGSPGASLVKAQTIFST
jgi:hypothetical protein